jgi:uncharacterized protein
MIENIPSPAVPIKKQIWGFWSTAGFGLVVGFIFLVTQTLVTVAFIVAGYIQDTGVDLSRFTDRLLEDGDLLSAATIASAVICGGLILIIVKVRHGASIAEYLALKPVSKKAVITMLAITAGFLVISFAASYFMPETPDSDYTTGAYNNASLKPLFWIATVIFAPIFEEIFMRGFLFIGFRQSRIGPVGAVIFTSLIWAALHIQYDFFQIAIIFVLGIILGAVRHKTESLLSPLIIHSLNNLVAMVLVSLP